MVFSSISFLLYFLPLALLIYYFLGKSWRNAGLLIISILFYAWGAPKFVFLLLLSTYIDFYLVRALSRAPEGRQRKGWLSMSIILNVGLLLYFKYAGFFVESFSTLLNSWGIGTIIHFEILLPIGISFYTFQTLTYSIDVYRREVAPLEKARDYLLYIFLFPQMIAGPIVRFSSIAEEIRNRRVDLQQLELGMHRFALGLGKKVLIANPCGAIADRYLALDYNQLSSPDAWIAILAYTFQIFFDFSGYSDMAIGLGRMLGFTFPENFNRPYRSRSITEFWQRWHITLGSWMRDYLYIPLGGNKKGRSRTYLNLWLVFLISGLWHGASWNFVAWGAFHGLLLVIERIFRNQSLPFKLPDLLKMSLTFILVVLGWVLFRIEEFPDAAEFYQRLFAGGLVLGQELKNFDLFILICGALLSFWPIRGFDSLELKQSTSVIANLKLFRSLSLILFSLMGLAASGFNPFIYFRF